MRFLSDNSQCSTQRSDLIIIQSVWNEINKLRRFLEASWRCCHSSSGFSLSQFVLFLHIIQDRLMMIRSDLSVVHKQKSHRIITINGQMNVWKCKLIFPTDTLQQKMRVLTDLKPFLVCENTRVSNNFVHHCI